MVTCICIGVTTSSYFGYYGYYDLNSHNGIAIIDIIAIIATVFVDEIFTIAIIE